LGVVAIPAVAGANLNPAPPISGSGELGQLEAILRAENIPALIDVRTHYMMLYFKKIFFFYEIDHVPQVCWKHRA
jgi:hypothetical protein